MGPDELIPIFGMITGIVVTLGIIFGVVQLTKRPVGQALARRIQGRGSDAGGEVRTELAELRDFAERMLSQGHPADRLPER